MNWNTLKTPFKALVIVAVVALSVWAILPVQQKIRFGLDLQGGSRLLLQLYPTAEVPKITTQVQAQTREVIDRRINGLGVAEPSISNVGSDRILVELPNVKNPDEAERVLKEVAVLEYKIVPPEVEQKGDARSRGASQPERSGERPKPPPKPTSRTAPTTRAVPSSIRARISRRRRPASIRAISPTSFSRRRTRPNSAS